MDAPPFRTRPSPIPPPVAATSAAQLCAAPTGSATRLFLPRPGKSTGIPRFLPGSCSPLATARSRPAQRELPEQSATDIRGLPGPGEAWSWPPGRAVARRRRGACRDGHRTPGSDSDGRTPRGDDDGRRRADREGIAHRPPQGRFPAPGGTRGGTQHAPGMPQLLVESRNLSPAPVVAGAAVGATSGRGRRRPPCTWRCRCRRSCRCRPRRPCRRCCSWSSRSPAPAGPGCAWWWGCPPCRG